MPAGGVHYELHGDDSQPHLILSAGLGGSSGYWTPNLAALARHFRVVAYDHRGTGHSDRTPLDTTSVAEMAADVRMLMDEMDIERAHFVGHALGAMIGLELAAATGRIDRLVAANGWKTLDPHTRRCFATRRALLRGSGPEAYLRAQPLFLYPPDWISAQDAALEDELARHLAAFPHPATVEARLAAVQSWALRPIGGDCAVLVIGARDDFLVPVAQSRALAEAIPGAAYAELDRGGHACNVADPESFNRIVLDFLRR